MRVYGRRALPLAALILATSLFLPVAAGAATVEAVPDFVNGSVALQVEYDVTTTEVRLYQSGVVRQSLVVAPSDRSALTTEVPLRAKTVFKVQGLDHGLESFAVTVTLDPATFRPATPRITSPTLRKVVNQYVDVTATNTMPFTAVKVRSDIWAGWRVNRMALAYTYTTNALRILRGPALIQVIHHNGFGDSPAAGQMVYYVGTVPGTTRSVVIDKSYVAAYHIYAGRVVRWWPVALGKAGTPTPNGDFKIGAPSPSSGEWGVLRRRLYRTNGTATMFYIHGTNAPWTIGTFASHGCVRMHNAHIAEFSRTVPNGTIVRIH